MTGNVIENAAQAAISAGWGEYLRDVSISGNVVRQSGIGVAVSVAKGAGIATITGNVLSGAERLSAAQDQRQSDRLSCHD